MLVYFHRNPKTFKIFYVGIGNETRPNSFYKSSRNELWHKYVNKHGKPVVQIVHENLSKIDACKWEMFYIGLFGIINNGGILVNMTFGGETSPMNNPEVAKKVHDQLRGRSRPDMAINNPMFLDKNKEISRKLMSEKIRFMKTPESEKGRVDRLKIRMVVDNPMYNIGHRSAYNEAIIKRDCNPDFMAPLIQRMKTDNPMFNSECKEKSFSKTRKPVYMICRHTDEVVIKFRGQNDAARFMQAKNAGALNRVLNKNKILWGYKWQSVA